MIKIGLSFACFLVGAIGVLGTGAQIESQEYLVAVWLAILTLVEFTLGVWLFRRGKQEMDSWADSSARIHSRTESRGGDSAGDLLLHVLSGVFAILFLYALSIGPVIRIAQSRSIPPSTLLQQIYAPLFWICDHTPLEYPMGWYLDFWIPDRIPKT